MISVLEHHELWQRMAKAMSCGYCGEEISIESEFTCTSCGRMLCNKCGKRWGWCKDHIPVCGHSELTPTQWDQKKPSAEKMIGSCKHNMSCPTCGYGWGSAPDPCEMAAEEE